MTGGHHGLWEPGDGLKLLAMCCGSQEHAEMLSRMVSGIENRELSDDDLRVMALAVRFGVVLGRSAPPSQN